MAELSTVPPYSEEEATRWLAWLAYQMKERDLTLFEIEGLQPDWLTSLNEIVSHVLSTRILLGVFCVLAYSPISYLVSYVTFYRALRDGVPFIVPDPSNFTVYSRIASPLIYSLVAGLIIGLSEVIIPIHKTDVWLNNRNSATGNLLIGTIAHGLLFGLIWSLISGGMTGNLTFSLMIGSTYGLIFGYIRTSRITQRSVGSHISTADSLKWSWKRAGYNARKGLLLGLLLGLFINLPQYFFATMNGSQPTSISLIEYLIIGLILGLMEGFINGVVIGSVYTWISVLIGGFQPAPLSMKTYPNQGIWLTLKSALKLSLLPGVLVGILIWLSTRNIEGGLSYSIIITFAIALWYGGLDVIEHAIIRLIIAMRGHAPLNYARFLDYAANELNFLQKVGGGYAFIHRYLLDHFAEIAMERGYVDVNARRHPQSF